MTKFVYTFINQYGCTFTYTTGEAEGVSDLTYIKYCLDAGSILVDMQPKTED